MSEPDRAARLAAARRVLCIQPHYDDNDLGAGGTLASLAERGAELHYLTVTDDLVGVLDPDVSDAEARERLRSEQREAGALIGVTSHLWLDLPDAGAWSEHVLCRHVVEALRRLRPDIVVTVDPWLPHEAHLDHTRTGRAVAQALLLRGFPRYPTAPEIDAAWRADPGPAVQGLVLYFTREPNLVFDIERTRERKHRAIDCYRSQLQGDELRGLHAGLGALERRWAANHTFSHGEALRWLSPAELHVGIA